MPPLFLIVRNALLWSCARPFCVLRLGEVLLFNGVCLFLRPFCSLSANRESFRRFRRRDGFSIHRKFRDAAALLYPAFLIPNCQIAYRNAEKPWKIP